MIEQPSLFAPIIPSKKTGTIDERFADFHAKNPQVYRLLVKLARQMRAAGRERIGIKALFERARWEYALNRNGEEYKLDNSFTSRYARLIAQQHPDLASMFEMRKLRRKAA